MAMEAIFSDIWTLTKDQESFGLKIDNRMTVVRLPDHRLWIHSPVRLLPGDQAELDALGEPSYVVAPNRKHYLYLEGFHNLYPKAKLYGAPQLGRKLEKLFPKIKLNAELESQTPKEWNEVFDQHLIEGSPVFQEVVFLHKPSKTLITTDLLYRMGSVKPGIIRRAIRLLGFNKPRGLFSEWFMPIPIDARKLGESIEYILDWDFEHIIMAHGDSVRHQGKAVLQKAYRRFLN